MKHLLLTLLAAVATAATAQPLRPDTAVRIGRLPNGLTYILRHNEYPAGRACFYIAQRVGAILETKEQDGLAHFLEHMAFNGTRNFPDKGIIDYLETVGVKFGESINAYTALDQTVYNLDNVPTTRDAIVDSALLVLHDWSGFITLADDEIDKERGVILEEWRTRNTAARRNYYRIQSVIMAGTPYADCNVIGDTAVIKNFPYKLLRDYYHKWYRPDLQGIIVVGDIDIDRVENKIQELWSDIPAPVDAAQRIYFSIPDNAEPIVTTAVDDEATSTQIVLEFRHNPLPPEVINSEQGYATAWAQQLIASVATSRFVDIASKPTAPITAGGAYYAQETPTKDCMTFAVIAKTGRTAEAVTLLLDEVERLHRFGITTSELDRAKAKHIKAYQNAYDARAKRLSNSYVKEYYNAFLSDEVITSPEADLELVQRVVPPMTLDQLNTMATQLTQDNVLLYATGSTNDTGMPTVDALTAEYHAAATKPLTAYVDQTPDRPLVAHEPQPAKVKKIKKNALMGADEWTLSNGVHVLLLPTKLVDNEILFTAVSRGGMSLMDTSLQIAGRIVADVAAYSGRGDFSRTELNKVLAGRSASVSVSVGTYSEALNGKCATADAEVMLQLAYLSFGTMRRDTDAFAMVIDSYRTSLTDNRNNPKTAFRDTIRTVCADGNPYAPLLDLGQLERITHRQVTDIYDARFANAADFTFLLVGDFDTDSIRPLVERWIGGLPTNKTRETAIDRHILYPRRIINKYFTRPMTTDKQSTYIIYTGDFTYTRNNDLTLRILSELLDMRYLDTVREEEGGSYGVSTWPSIGGYNNDEYTLNISFDTDPALFDKLLPIIERELRSIAEHGPDATDFAKVKENLIKSRAEQLQRNTTWKSLITTYLLKGVDKYTDFDAQVTAVTADDIRRCAQRILDDGNVITVSMSPEKDN